MPSGWKAKARVARSDEAAAERRERPLPARLLDWSGGALVAIAWASAALFGAYIVFFYAGAIAAGTPEQWNANLPGLFVPAARIGTAGIAAHFAAGRPLPLPGPPHLVAPT